VAAPHGAPRRALSPGGADGESRGWPGHVSCNYPLKTEDNMFSWAIIFFIVALVAAVLGFGGLAASAAGAAKIVFFVALILAIVGFVMGRRVD
jgi:uncharacterized membrane protein YtjA (UPF0391 family)